MRWKVLAVLVALTAASAVFTVFYMDSFVKGKIESAGSSAVGAKVSLEGFAISLRNQSVLIEGMEVADPDDPWQNLFEIRSVYFDFSLPQLLMGNLIIEKVTADTPRWGTKRDSYGGIKKEPEAAKVEAPASEKGAPPASAPAKKGFDIDWQKYLPKVDLTKEFSVESVVNPEKMGSLKKLDEAIKYAEGRDEQWKNRIETIKKEYDSVNKSRDIKKITAFLQTVDAARKELSADIKRVDDMAKLVKKLRDEDLKDIGGLIGIGGSGRGGLSQDIFSDAFREKLQKGYRLFTTYKDKLMGGKKDDKKRRLKGQTVAFPVKDPKPRFHLVKAELKAAKGAREGNWLAGTLTDVTSNPKMVGKPVDFKLAAGSVSFPGAQFAVTGVADLTKAMSRFEMKVSADKLSTKPVTSALGGDSPLALSGGAMSVAVDFAIEGDVIKSVFAILLDGITIAVSEKALSGTDPSVKNILKGTLADVKKVSLTGKAKGRIDDLRVSIKSNVDDIFKKALDRAVSRARKEMEKRIRTELDKELAKRVPELKGILGDDNKELTDMNSTLKSAQKRIEGEVQKRIDAERKKQEERLNKERKKQEDKLKEELKKRFKLPF